jgi:hypothetical protein
VSKKKNIEIKFTIDGEPITLEVIEGEDKLASLGPRTSKAFGVNLVDALRAFKSGEAGS